MLHRAVASAWLVSIVPALLACGGGSPHIAPVVPHALEFIENDWPRALAEARSRHVPVFVEAWAPW